LACIRPIKDIHCLCFVTGNYTISMHLWTQLHFSLTSFVTCVNLYSPTPKITYPLAFSLPHFHNHSPTYFFPFLSISISLFYIIFISSFFQKFLTIFRFVQYFRHTDKILLNIFIRIFCHQQFAVQLNKTFFTFKMNTKCDKQICVY
jgi:hypothetical protein